MDTYEVAAGVESAVEKLLPHNSSIMKKNGNADLKRSLLHTLEDIHESSDFKSKWYLLRFGVAIGECAKGVYCLNTGTHTVKLLDILKTHDPSLFNLGKIVVELEAYLKKLQEREESKPHVNTNGVCKKFAIEHKVHTPRKRGSSA